FIATAAFAASETRLTGRVIDLVTNKPIKDVSIHVEDPVRHIDQAFRASADGTYKITVASDTMYKLTFTAPGYISREETLTTGTDAEQTKDVALRALPPPRPMDPASIAFDDGMKALRENRDDLAIAKFKEAIAANGEMVSAWEQLARIYCRTK